jgi:hypothetical protein
MTTKTLNPDAIQTLKLLRCGPHVLEVLAAANDQIAKLESFEPNWTTHSAQLAAIDKAESELFALGVQCEALKARLKLAEYAVEALRLAKTELAHIVHVMKRGGGMYEEALVAARSTLDAFDAVPGDVGANMSGVALSAIYELDAQKTKALSPAVRPAAPCAKCGHIHALAACPRWVGTIGGVPVVEDASVPDGFVKDGGDRYGAPCPCEDCAAIRAVQPNRALLAQAAEMQASIDRLTVQRDAAEALARERAIERDNYGQELDKATGMVEMHVDDAAAARLLWRQSEAACAKMNADLDAAQRVAAEFRGALADIADSEDEKGRPSTREWMQRRAKEVLVSHGPNRFCMASERDEARLTIKRVEMEVLTAVRAENAAIAQRDEAVAILRDLVKPGFDVVAYAAAAYHARKLVG